MTILTDETKAKLMRDALGKLAGQYMAEGRTKEAQGVLGAQIELNCSGLQRVGQFTESLSRLYDIIIEASPK